MHSFNVYLKERLTEIDVVIHQLLQRELLSLESEFVLCTEPSDVILHSTLGDCTEQIILEMDAEAGAIKYLPELNCELLLEDNSWEEAICCFITTTDEQESTLTLDAEGSIQLGYYQLLRDIDHMTLDELDQKTLHEVDFVTTSD